LAVGRNFLSPQSWGEGDDCRRARRGSWKKGVAVAGGV